MTKEFAITVRVENHIIDTFSVYSDEDLTKESVTIQNLSQRALKFLLRYRLDLMGKDIVLHIYCSKDIKPPEIRLSSSELSEIYKRCRESNFR